jgi:hypothetical protein
MIGATEIQEELLLLVNDQRTSPARISSQC